MERKQNSKTSNTHTLMANRDGRGEQPFSWAASTKKLFSFNKEQLSALKAGKVVEQGPWTFYLKARS